MLDSSSVVRLYVRHDCSYEEIVQQGRDLIVMDLKTITGIGVYSLGSCCLRRRVRLRRKYNYVSHPYLLGGE